MSGDGGRGYRCKRGARRPGLDSGGESGKGHERTNDSKPFKVHLNFSDGCFSLSYVYKFEVFCVFAVETVEAAQFEVIRRAFWEKQERFVMTA